jgi:hypothetical protein
MYADFESAYKPTWLRSSILPSLTNWNISSGKLVCNVPNDHLTWSAPLPSNIADGIGFITSYTIEGDGAFRITAIRNNSGRETWLEIEGSQLYPWDSLNGGRQPAIGSVVQPVKIEVHDSGPGTNPNGGRQYKIGGDFFLKDIRQGPAVSLRTGSYVSVDNYGVWVEPTGPKYEFFGGGGFGNQQPHTLVSKPFCDRAIFGPWPFGNTKQIQVTIPANGWAMFNPPPPDCANTIAKRTGSFVLDYASDGPGADGGSAVFSLAGDFGYGALAFQLQLEYDPIVARFTWPGDAHSMVAGNINYTGNSINDDIVLSASSFGGAGVGIIHPAGFNTCAGANLSTWNPGSQSYDPIWIITPLP